MQELETKQKSPKNKELSNSTIQKGNGKKGFEFVDNRPEIIAQRKLITVSNNNPGALQQKSLWESVNKTSSQQQKQPIQRVALNKHQNPIIQFNKTKTGGVYGALIGGIGGAVYGGIYGLAGGPPGVLAGAAIGAAGAIGGGVIGATGGAIAEQVSPSTKKKLKVDEPEPEPEVLRASSSAPKRKQVQHPQEASSSGMAAAATGSSSGKKADERSEAEHLKIAALKKRIGGLRVMLSDSKYAAKVLKKAQPADSIDALEIRLAVWQDIARKSGESANRDEYKVEAGAAAAAGAPLRDLAGEAREERLAQYIALLGHLAGKEDGGKITGGHLLTAMQAKFGAKLIVQGAQNNGAPWAGSWGTNRDKLKRSTFFPANWTIADLRRELEGSNSVRGGLSLPSGIYVQKAGGTFYPVLG